MEVHAHSHTARKKWTHYFWEFLMLFLAVFCGFLAENIREHGVEHQREKQFMKSLLNDLRLDINWLDTVTNSAKTRIANIDSAITTFSQPESKEISVKVYRHLRSSTTQIMFFPNNGTITQLKNSGGMRLISKREVVDSIEDYDRLMRRLEVRRDITNELVHDFTEVLNKTVTGKDLLNALYDSAFLGGKVTKQTIKLNNQYVNELINQSISIRLRAVSDTAANFFVKKSASKLIDFIRKEYHLK